jgi:ketosteroid isomerase-like protein
MKPIGPLTISALLAVLTSMAVVAQDIKSQIEKDVWQPLFSGSNTFDADLFLSAQSRDLIRVAVDQKLAYGIDRYSREIREGFKRVKDRGIVRKSDARFTERSSDDDYAFETGYFRSEVTMPTGEKRIRYSRFEFVLRRESGKWKILVDRDTSAGPEITEEIYLRASPMGSTIKKP